MPNSKPVLTPEPLAVLHSSDSSLSVLRVTDIDAEQLCGLLLRFGLTVVDVQIATPIPGSYWGDSEAGLIGGQLYLRADTPVQSVLHEAAHFICMDASRRAALHQDAGGNYEEENAVCYLQILLADHVPGMGRLRMLADMDAWGYTFRLGSAHAWFEWEALDAQRWLESHGVIDERRQPTWRVRDQTA